MQSQITFVHSLNHFLPQIVAGDFNVVTSLEEKRGGVSRLGPSSNMLRDNIGFLNLIDIKPGNGIFTQNNRRIGMKAISERLDRFLVSCFWMDVRWSTRSEVLDWRNFDHWPIKLSITPFKAIKNPSFKFQLMWLRDPFLQDLMIVWWHEGRPSHGTTMFSFEKRLQHVKFRLKKWNKQYFGNVQDQKSVTQSRLDNVTPQIRDQGMTMDLITIETSALRVLEE